MSTKRRIDLVQNKKYCDCNRNPNINYDKENCCAHFFLI
jgi:hypothetical protein